MQGKAAKTADCNVTRWVYTLLVVPQSDEVMWKNTDTYLEVGKLVNRSVTEPLPKHGPVLPTFVHTFNSNNGASR